MKGAVIMSAIDQTIKEILAILKTLDEEQLIYIRTYLKTKFGVH